MYRLKLNDTLQQSRLSLDNFVETRCFVLVLPIKFVIAFLKYNIKQMELEYFVYKCKLCLKRFVGHCILNLERRSRVPYPSGCNKRSLTAAEFKGSNKYAFLAPASVGSCF